MMLPCSGVDDTAYSCHGTYASVAQLQTLCRLLGSGGQFSNPRSPARLQLVAAVLEFAKLAVLASAAPKSESTHAFAYRYLHSLEDLCATAREVAARELALAQLATLSVRTLLQQYTYPDQPCLFKLICTAIGTSACLRKFGLDRTVSIAQRGVLQSA